MHCIFFQFWGTIEIFFIPPPPSKNKIYFQILGWYRSIFIPKMIHLLVFQSIKNVLYFLKFKGGFRNIFILPAPYTTMHCIFFSILGNYRNIFYTPTPSKNKIYFQILGWYRSIFIPKMIHLLVFQSIKNVLYFFEFGHFLYPTPFTKKLFWGGGV